MAQDMEIQRTAYHEAGHTVLDWTYGLPFDRVSIIPTEDHRGAVNMYLTGATFNEFDTEFMEAHARAQLAGEVAEEILTGTPTDWAKWLGVEGSDIENYKELALRVDWYEMVGNVMDLTPVLEERAIDVRALLSERWAAVEAVAATLLHDKEISGTEALRLMAETDVPGPVASVWADLLEERREEAEARARFEAEK